MYIYIKLPFIAQTVSLPACSQASLAVLMAGATRGAPLGEGSADHNGLGHGTARKRRAQRQRQAARHVEWLWSLKRSSESHHTATAAWQSRAHIGDDSALVARLQTQLADLQEQVTNLALMVTEGKENSAEHEQDLSDPMKSESEEELGNVVEEQVGIAQLGHIEQTYGSRPHRVVVSKGEQGHKSTNGVSSQHSCHWTPLPVPSPAPMRGPSPTKTRAPTTLIADPDASKQDQPPRPAQAAPDVACSHCRRPTQPSALCRGCLCRHCWEEIMGD